MVCAAAILRLFELRTELAAVDEMLHFAKQHAARPDARVTWLVDWIRTNMVPGGRWNDRRLILFTEWEDTRRWLQRRLLEALEDTDRINERIDVFTGATGTDRREAVKLAFNADPATEPLCILICTDAAREGINLQTRCHDLIHVDLPCNPSRLEQRNVRIDCKLQPAPEVFCRYFVYAQRDEDIVLAALVRKTETIRVQLGSVGQVIEQRIADRLNASGIERGRAAALAEAIDAETDMERLARARAEMDDIGQHGRLEEGAAPSCLIRGALAAEDHLPGQTNPAGQRRSKRYSAHALSAAKRPWNSIKTAETVAQFQTRYSPYSSDTDE